MTSFPVIAKEVSEDQEQNQIIIWATSKAEFHKDLKDARIVNEEWAYRGEYIFILTMDETEHKVNRVIEFVDSKGTERLKGLMMRARANKAQKEKAAQTRAGDSKVPRGSLPQICVQ